jgi:hypothetical protein
MYIMRKLLHDIDAILRTFTVLCAKYLGSSKAKSPRFTTLCKDLTPKIHTIPAIREWHFHDGWSL